MKTKILIRVEGGIVQSICSNNPSVEIAVVDYDNVDNGEPAFNGIISTPDVVQENMYELIDAEGGTPSEKEAREELKRIHF